MGLLKHFAPWEHILPPGSYFDLRVLKHFWIKLVWFFWSKCLNKFSIKIWYSSKYDSIPQKAKCFNDPNLYATDTNFYNSSINIGYNSFFSSPDMHQSHNLSGYHATGINTSLSSFLSSFRFLSLVCLTKKLFWLEKKLKQFAWQGSFFNSC